MDDLIKTLAQNVSCAPGSGLAKSRASRESSHSPPHFERIALGRGNLLDFPPHAVEWMAWKTRARVGMHGGPLECGCGARLADFPNRGGAYVNVDLGSRWRGPGPARHGPHDHRPQGIGRLGPAHNAE